ncbi:MAG: hypothetical protein QOJ59_4887 [Thermomicrobiales bacterium]|jgi:hypothetical protein|nr:hypothetical protein [Thermomicrobiales bacterium]
MFLVIIARKTSDSTVPLRPLAPLVPVLVEAGADPHRRHRRPAVVHDLPRRGIRGSWAITMNAMGASQSPVCCETAGLGGGSLGGRRYLAPVCTGCAGRCSPRAGCDAIAGSREPSTSGRALKTPTRHRSRRSGMACALWFPCRKRTKSMTDSRRFPLPMKLVACAPDKRRPHNCRTRAIRGFLRRSRSQT